MTGRSLFGVVVRALGLWLVLRAITGLAGSLINAVAVDAVLLAQLRGGWLWSVLSLLGGLFLLRAAPLVVRFAYPADDEGS